MTLREQLKGVKVVMVDNNNELTLAWFGGHGIHAFNDNGDEVSFWNVGSFAQDSASKETVIASMEEHIKTGEYA